MSSLTLLTLLCGFFIALCRSQTCPSGNFFPYSCGWCLSFSSGSQRNFSQSQNACGDFNVGMLAVAGTEQELRALRDYAGALGSSFWIGYRYNSSSTLVLSSDVATQAPTLVSDAVSGGVASNEGVCVAIDADGSLTRYPCSEELGHACQFNLTDPTVANIVVAVNGQLVGNELVVANFSDSIIIECSFSGTDDSSVVQWLLNGREVDSVLFNTTENRSSSTLSVMFEMAGIYQCVVTNTDGRSATGEVDVCGDIEGENPPGSVSFIAIPENQTSLFVRWFRPGQLNALHPLLLRYTLFYSTNTTATIDYDFEESVTGLVTDANGEGTYFLNGLSIGTEYRVTMRASSGIIMGEKPVYVIGVSTYGVAPNVFPDRLRLSRNRDNTALLAEWEPITTTPPTGNISFYQVEFRSGIPELQDIVSTIFINPGFSFASIFGVMEAEAYQVRVTAAVQVQRLRGQNMYELGPFTEWIEVTVIVAEVPSSATIIPIEPEPEPDNTAILLAAVLAPTLAIIVSILVTVVIIVCCVTNPFRVHVGHQEDSPKSPTSATASASNMEVFDKNLTEYSEEPTRRVSQL